MRQHSTIRSFALVVLIVALAVPLTVESCDFGGSAASSISAADDSPAGAKKKSGEGGGGFARALAAPFRALGKLFGGGKKQKAPRPAAEAVKKSVEPAVKASAQSGVNPVPGATAGHGGELAAPARTEQSARRSSGSAERKPRAAERATVTGPRVAEETHSPEQPPGARAAANSAPISLVTVIEGVPFDPLSQGRALLDRGHLDEAIAELSVAATVGPDLIEANNLLGLAYDRRGRHKQAQECYERALSAAPDDPGVLHNFGFSLYLENNHGAALKRLKQAARLAPQDPRILRSTGLVQTRLGKYDDAFKSFARAEGEFPARLRLAAMLESVGRDKEAIKQYEAALRIQPTSPIVLEHLAELYQRTGRRNEAEAVRRTLTKPGAKTVTGGGG
ncbi:MAG: tetratricopeptide repeat protein [Pyrinomonadaceae bacterium]